MNKVYKAATELQTLALAAYAADKDLVLDGDSYILSANLILTPATTINRGVIIDLNGFTLTFSRDLFAGEYQIFKGLGKVIGNKVSVAYSDWFAPAKDGYMLDPLSADEVAKTYKHLGVTIPYGTAPAVTVTDDTYKLQQLFDINAKKTIISDGIYMIDSHGNSPYDGARGGLKFRDKTRQTLRINGTLKKLRGDKVNGNLIRWYNNHHCTVIGNKGINLEGDLFEHTLAPFDEGGTGIYIARSTYCFFINFEARLFTGDSTMVTFPRTYGESYEVDHLYFINVKGNYCRRTGHVLEVGNYIYHDKCQWNKNGLHINGGVGTWSGVDIEPLSYADSPIRYVGEAYFNECEANDNRGAGLRLEKLLSGRVTGCVVKRNSVGIAALQTGYGNRNITSSTDRMYKESVVIIDNNHIEENYSAGITSDIQKPSRVNIHNNHFWKNNTDINGRFIDSTMHHNISRETKNRWLYITEAKDCQITYNKVIDIIGSSAATDSKVVINAYNEMGGVHAISVINGGTGYSDNPTITITGGSGAGALAIAKVLGGVIKSVYMTQTAKGYLFNPTVTVTDSTGTGAVLEAHYRSSIDNLTIANNEFTLSAPDGALTRNINKPKWFANVGSTTKGLKWFDNYVDPRQYTESVVRVEVGAEVLYRNTADLMRPQRLRKHDTILSDKFAFGRAIVLADGSLPYGRLFVPISYYEIGDIIRTEAGYMYVCSKTGTSAATAPTREGVDIVNGTATFSFKDKMFSAREITYI